MLKEIIRDTGEAGASTQANPAKPRVGRLDIEKLKGEFESKTPQGLMKWALKEFHPGIVLVWSGAKDVVVVDMMVKINPYAPIFTLDTGRLNPETYELIDKLRERYGIDIEVIFPDSAEIEGLVRPKGTNLFYKSIENRKLCCNMRKVQPLINRVQASRFYPGEGPAKDRAATSDKG